MSSTIFKQLRKFILDLPIQTGYNCIFGQIMTSGIYQLTFHNGHTYVGQAGNIEARYLQHCDKLQKGDAALRMQQAYDGILPAAKVLIECHQDYLDAMEAYYIHQLNPTLNTVKPKLRTDEEMEYLVTNCHLMRHPPATLIYNLGKREAELKEATDQLNDCIDQYNDVKDTLNNRLLHLRVEAELKQGKDYNASRVKSLEKQLSEKTLTIEVLYKRSLWQRILNSPV